LSAENVQDITSNTDHIQQPKSSQDDSHALPNLSARLNRAQSKQNLNSDLNQMQISPMGLYKIPDKDKEQESEPHQPTKKL
jgi:hypothetical protein